jgi:hypothetical protein
MEDLFSQLPSRRADAMTFAEAALHQGNLTANLIEEFLREDNAHDDNPRRFSRHQLAHGQVCAHGRVCAACTVRVCLSLSLSLSLSLRLSVSLN